LSLIWLEFLWNEGVGVTIGTPATAAEVRTRVSATPSAVLGFLAIAVVGETIRAISRASFMKWVPIRINRIRQQQTWPRQ